MSGVLVALVIVVVTTISTGILAKLLTGRVEGKLNVIHDLVNSNMSAAKRAQLAALKGQVVLMMRVSELNKEAGTEPTEDEIAAIEAVQAQVAELEAESKDRLKLRTDAVPASTLVE